MNTICFCYFCYFLYSRFDYLSRDLNSRLITMTLFLFGFCIPFVLIVLFYALMLRTLRSKGHSIGYLLNMRSDFRQNNPNRLINSNSRARMLMEMSDVSTVVARLSQTNVQLRAAVIRREIQATKTVLIFVGVFCISWLPYAVIVLFAHFGTDIEEHVTPLTASLPALFAKTSTVFNPLIYTLTNPECKAHIKRLFRIV